MACLGQLSLCACHIVEGGGTAECALGCCLNSCGLAHAQGSPRGNSVLETRFPGAWVAVGPTAGRVGREPGAFSQLQVSPGGRWAVPGWDARNAEEGELGGLSQFPVSLSSQVRVRTDDKHSHGS